MIPLRTFSFVVAMALPQVVASQVAPLDAALRPLARPGAALATPGPAPTTTLLTEPQRPRARLVRAPGRPEPRPADVLPQPVSLFLRTGMAPVSPLAAAAASPMAPLPPLTPLAAPASPIAFLPASPLRLPLIRTPVPLHERRLDDGIAVSAETAALSALILGSVTRARAAQAAAASVVTAGPTPPASPAARPDPDPLGLDTLGPDPLDAANPIRDEAPARPRSRPAAQVTVPEAAPAGYSDDLVARFLSGAPMAILSPDASDLAVAAAFRPPDRPDSIAAIAAGVERAASERLASLARGSVCGVIDIQGVALGSVPGPGACGVENAVEVRSIAGVRLSSPSVMDCRTAETLRDWVVNSAAPAFSGTGGGLEGLSVMGAYSCRGRNGVAGARLSEHAYGRAIDIGGFTFRDGTTLTVLNGWNSARGDVLRALHRAACRLFGTVLGPASDAQHRNHFHLDTARSRNGSYCR